VIDGAFDVGWHADVAGNGERAAAGCPDLGGDVVELVLAAAEECDGGASFGEQDGDGCADAAAGSGDERGLAAELRSIHDVPFGLT
jgi:hypothetical protein